MLSEITLDNWLEPLRTFNDFMDNLQTTCLPIAYPDDNIPLTVQRPIRPYRSKIDWVICGGETGPNARPCHPTWLSHLQEQCQAVDIPFFFKGYGDWAPYRKSNNPECYLKTLQDNEIVMPAPPGWITMVKVGRKAAGRSLNGREWNEIPF